MKFFTKSRYALRIMIELASRSRTGSISLKTLAEDQKISLKYLEQIIVPLAKAGLVAGERGSQGGYRLAVSPEECTAGDVLRAIEGSLAPVDCLSPGAEDCEMQDVCPTVDFWRGLGQCMEKYTDGFTLARLASRNAAKLRRLEHLPAHSRP